MWLYPMDLMNVINGIDNAVNIKLYYCFIIIIVLRIENFLSIHHSYKHVYALSTYGYELIFVLVR